MKKFILSLVCIGSLFLIAGCSNDDTPKGAAACFINACKAGEVDAKKYYSGLYDVLFPVKYPIIAGGSNSGTMYYHILSPNKIAPLNWRLYDGKPSFTMDIKYKSKYSVSQREPEKISNDSSRAYVFIEVKEVEILSVRCYTVEDGKIIKVGDEAWETKCLNALRKLLSDKTFELKWKMQKYSSDQPWHVEEYTLFELGRILENKELTLN